MEGLSDKGHADIEKKTGNRGIQIRPKYKNEKEKLVEKTEWLAQIQTTSTITIQS